MFRGGYQIRDQHAIHFITFAVVEWIDVFTRKEYAEIVIESLAFCQKEKGLNIHAWVIMSNHLHLVLSAEPPNKLSDVLRDFKKFTSFRIIKVIEENKKESRRNWMLWIFRSAGERNKRNENHQFWRQENHPIECNTAEILESKINYVHENPVRAGIVKNEWDYVYSSAIDYCDDGKGLLEIAFV